ncbi:MAG: response regulator [Leptolyngbyaceae bacterium]|nr:response regulator [Leptolyngbyaceae bacterium]
MRILVVENNELAAHQLTGILAHQNYAVEVAAEEQAAWELVQAFDYDLILLNVLLPKLDGIRLCRKLRAQGWQMPILLLTERDGSHDKAIGLDAGADDYVVKPFDEEELVARIRALLRRGGPISQPVLEWGNLRLDPSSCEVTYGTKLLSLTPKEYALLELFLRSSSRVFSCDAILEHLWAYEDTPGEEAVRTHVKGLRQKFKAVGLPTDVIETVYGIGYRLKPLKALTTASQAKVLSHRLAPPLSCGQVPSGTVVALPFCQEVLPLLLVVDRDRSLAEALVNEATRWGFQGAIALNLDTAREQLSHAHPRVVLLDPDLDATMSDGLALLAELHHSDPTVPIIVLTAHDSLKERIEVARQGGHTFLHKPVSPTQVLETVTQVLYQTDPVEAKVMIVDDDPQILTVLHTVLEPCRLKLTMLDDPRKFWETLEACSPDLLILDVDMPDLSGIDLCQVVRNDAHWNALPVLFLAAHTETAVLNQAFAVGADDLVSKPIVGSELVTRVLNRLERIKVLHQSTDAALYQTKRGRCRDGAIARPASTHYC